MHTWAIPFVEVTSGLLLLWCVSDAWRRGSRFLLELMAGAFFGLAVEQLIILLAGGAGRPDAYGYGPFVWMATADVPLAVATSWGALLYAAMKYSDNLSIPAWMRPAADGLYALMLDLTMDVVAVRLGLWHWATPPEAQWFGVPYSNFGGWLLLAVLFSAGVRTARALAGRRPLLLYAGALSAALAAATLTMMVTGGRLFSGTEQDAWTVGLLACLAAGILAAGILSRKQDPSPAGPATPPGWMDPAVALPACWHLSYLGMALLTGIFADRLALLFLTGVMAAAGTLLAIGLARSS